MEFLLCSMEFPATAHLLDDPNVWIADTAATTHMSPHQVGMIGLRDADQDDGVTMGNKQVEKTMKVGNIPVTVCDKEGNELVKTMLQDVSMVPTCSYNLFSLTKMMKAGWTVIGRGDRLVIQKDGNEVVFDIAIDTSKGVLFAVYLKRSVAQTEISVMQFNGIDDEEREAEPLESLEPEEGTGEPLENLEAEEGTSIQGSDESESEEEAEATNAPSTTRSEDFLQDEYAPTVKDFPQGDHAPGEIACVGATIGDGFANTMDQALAGTEAPDWALTTIVEEHDQTFEHEVFPEIAREYVPVDTKILMSKSAMKKKARKKANGVPRAVRGAFLQRVFEKGQSMYTEVPQGFERLLLLQTLYGTKQALKSRRASVRRVKIDKSRATYAPVAS